MSLILFLITTSMRYPAHLDLGTLPLPQDPSTVFTSHEGPHQDCLRYLLSSCNLLPLPTASVFRLLAVFGIHLHPMQSSPMAHPQPVFFNHSQGSSISLCLPLCQPASPKPHSPSASTACWAADLIPPS